jgi:tetratricopeptide (TPR) repeat protein
MASTCHQLGIIAQEQRDFTEARDWYQQALEIWQKYGDEHNMAGTYYQFGKIAHELENFPEAQDWYQQALTLFERTGDEYHASIAKENLDSLPNG